MRAYPQLIASYLRAPMTALGTDGFGRSDTRAELRSFFEVSRRDIAIAALDTLANDGAIERSLVGEAIARYGVDPRCAPSWRTAGARSTPNFSSMLVRAALPNSAWKPSRLASATMSASESIAT